MRHHVENDRLRAAAKPLGAELVSLWDKKRERELIWQGDPAIWAGHSPLLFPVVGKVKGDQYLLGARAFPMEKHGFALHSPFALAKQSGSSLTFTLRDNPRTRECYPFAFEVEVSFSLCENRLEILHSVRNPSGEAALPFSIGAHPGFSCELGDQLIFEKAEEPMAHRFDGALLLNPVPVSVPMSGRALPITESLFVEDALIFPNLRSRSVILQSQNLGDLLRVDWYEAPVLGLWAKPGAPYVCVEPWYGIDDHAGVSDQLTEKPRIILLPPGESFHFPVTITALPQ